MGYTWESSSKTNHKFELLNVQYIRNTNPGNYFQTYESELDKLNEIAFDTKTESFRKKLKKEKGIVTIVANGQTIYYDYNVTKNKKSRNIFSRYRYISFRSVGRRIIRPFTGNGIFARTFKKLAMKPHKGYIAVSQPKYRHNDTVKVKAYIAKPNGRPINKEIEVRLYENSVSKYNIKYYKPISKATIQSDLDGNYKHEFVLGDSLKIDKTYYTAFIKKTNSLLICMC